MAGYKLLKRLEVIIHLLQNYPNASKKTLVERLEQDYDIITTNRTMERDFKALETEFGIGLQYQPTKKGYILDRKDEKRIQSFFKFVELVHLGELFKESLEDCSVWYYSKKLSGVLLTGNGKLRKQARKDNLEVRGIIFLFDELLKRELITFEVAIEKIKQLRLLNNRLPKKEIENRIDRWNKNKHVD